MDRGTHTEDRSALRVLAALHRDGICYINLEAAPGPAIELLEFATGRVSRVTVLEDARFLKDASSWGFSVSPDPRWILYVQSEDVSDIMLVENFH